MLLQCLVMFVCKHPVNRDVFPRDVGNCQAMYMGEVQFQGHGQCGEVDGLQHHKTIAGNPCCIP